LIKSTIENLDRLEDHEVSFSKVSISNNPSSPLTWKKIKIIDQADQDSKKKNSFRVNRIEKNQSESARVPRGVWDAGSKMCVDTLDIQSALSTVSGSSKWPMPPQSQRQSDQVFRSKFGQVARDRLTKKPSLRIKRTNTVGEPWRNTTVDTAKSSLQHGQVHPPSGSQRNVKLSRFSLKLTKTSNMLDNLACETTYKKYTKPTLLETLALGPTKSPDSDSPNRGPTIPKALIAKGGPGMVRPINLSPRKIQKEVEHCEGLSTILKKSLQTSDIKNCLSGQLSPMRQGDGSENDGSPLKFTLSGNRSPFAKARPANGSPIKCVKVPKKRFRDYLGSQKKNIKAETGLTESFQLLEENNYGSNPNMLKIMETSIEDESEMVGSNRKGSKKFKKDAGQDQYS
jgi:hypothetical protein